MYTPQGFTVTTKNSIITFMHESDYNNYMDFVNNGLKVIRKKDTSYIFNDGSRFLYVPAHNGMNEVRVLTDRHNKQFKNEKYFKKHLQTIAVYSK